MGMDGWREIESKRERKEEKIVCQVIGVNEERR